MEELQHAGMVEKVKGRVEAIKVRELKRGLEREGDVGPMKELYNTEQGHAVKSH